MSTDILSQKQRIQSIDILRGIIMIIMALDHVRDYFSSVPYDPLDLVKASPLLFFTRWITHFCAPTFVFLSGTSAWLSSKNKTKKETSLFLLKRGLWLMFLELTIISFGWQFDIGFHALFLQVIWAISWSMLVLAALVYLKPAAIGIIGLIIIFGHNALDAIPSASFGKAAPVWMLLHEQNFIQLTKYESVLILYPIIPWVGVMAVGYAFGTFFNRPQAERRALFIKIGLACLFLFLVLRGFNLYGDPFPWTPQPVGWRNILAIIRCQKYPPSLLYLLMTLGISILALAFLENVNTKLTRIFTVYGRVPFFYYLPHIYLVHGAQVLVAWLAGFPVSAFVGNFFAPKPAGWGFGLPFVYGVWILIVALLYFPCRWFMRLKQRRKDWWLSYV